MLRDPDYRARANAARRAYRDATAKPPRRIDWMKLATWGVLLAGCVGAYALLFWAVGLIGGGEDGFGSRGYSNATHWQPLPAPPTQEAK